MQCLLRRRRGINGTMKHNLPFIFHWGDFVIFNKKILFVAVLSILNNFYSTTHAAKEMYLFTF